MAEFNPTIGATEAPNFTGRSQGGGADTSFETLFKGIGNAIEAGTQTADTFVQNKIEDDARYAFDSINQEMGFEATDYQEGKPNVPPEILQSSDSLRRLANAQVQGKVTQEYYYQRLASTMKGLRSKYPGYEKQVDDIITNVTGTRPANAFRDALFANINSAQAAASNEQDQFTRWAMSEGNAGRVTNMYPDFWTDPEKYSSAEARAQVMTQVNVRKGMIDQAEDTVKMNNADKTISGPQVSKWVNSVVGTHTFGTVQGAGVGEGQTNLLESALSDNVISPDEKASITTYVGQAKMKARQDVLDRWAKGGFAKNFSRAEINQFIDDSLSDLTQIEEFIASDNVSQAAVVAQRLKIMQDTDKEALYTQWPQLRTADVLRGVSEPGAHEVVEQVIAQAGGGQAFIDQSNRVLMQDISRASVAGTLKLEDKLSAIENAPGMSATEKQSVLGQSIDTELKALTTGKLTPEAIGTYVSNNYSDSLDTLFNMVDDSTVGSGNSQRLKLFQKMFDPKVTKALVDSGNEEALRQYTNAALDKAQSVPEFRRTAQDLGETISWNQFARVQYNPETNRLMVMTNPDALAKVGPSQGLDQRTFTRSLQKASNTFNDVLRVIAPVIEASGEDETQAIKSFARTLALDLNGGHEKGFFWYLSQGIDELLSPVGTGPKGEEEPSEEGFQPLPDGFEEPAVGESVGSELNYAPNEAPTDAQSAIDNIISDEVQFNFPLTDVDEGEVGSSTDVHSGLTGRGLPEHVVRGIVANLRDESGLRTDINERSPTVKGSRGGYGLAQWTGPRRRQLEAFAADRGVAPSDLDTQLDFLMYELNTSERGAYQRLLKTESAAQAAQVFLNHFERPAASHRKRRSRKYAKLD